MRVVHILHRSIPGTHGYAVRSREIVGKQLEKGLEPLVITSPSQSPMGPLDAEGSEYIEGVRYFRTGNRMLAPTVEVKDGRKTKAAFRVAQNAGLFSKTLKVARKYRPDVIHSHSPFTCGLAGESVGRILSIPVVYEMRGIWEDSHVARHKMSEQSYLYRLVRFLDNRALKGADLCCLICDALKTEVLSRGIIDESKVLITPNGVDVRRFVPGPADEDLKEELGLTGARVMGYIGTFFHYEGLDILVEAMAGLAGRYADLKLLLVGDGELMQRLREQVEKLGLSERVVFTGMIPHTQVTTYYRLCDYMVLPRRETRETRLVTPLKPMEIMAMARPLVASDIGGHRDSIVDGENGILFRSENAPDLVSKLEYLIEHPEETGQLAARSRVWVTEHRDWNVLVDAYISAYEALTKKE